MGLARHQIHQPATLPQWSELLAAAPGLARFEAEAAEAAANRFPGWLDWARASMEFARLVQQAAEATGTPYADAARVALDRLAATYDRAFRKRYGPKRTA